MPNLTTNPNNCHILCNLYLWFAFNYRLYFRGWIQPWTYNQGTQNQSIIIKSICFTNKNAISFHFQHSFPCKLQTSISDTCPSNEITSVNQFNLHNECITFLLIQERSVKSLRFMWPYMQEPHIGHVKPFKKPFKAFTGLIEIVWSLKLATPPSFISSQGSLAF